MSNETLWLTEVPVVAAVAVAVAEAVAVGWVVLKYSECSRVDEWSESITPPPSPPAGRPSEMRRELPLLTALLLLRCC